MVWFVAAALAGVTGEVKGQPFTGRSAVAVGDPQKPGVLSVFVSSEALHCGAAPPPSGVQLLLAFSSVAGAQADPGGMVTSPATKLFQVVQVDARLDSLPSTAGAQGQLTLTRAAADQTLVRGAMAYTLCELVAPPSPPVSALPVGAVQTNADGKGLTVTIGRPTEWTLGQDYRGAPQWTAPDGRTRFTLSDSCAGACDPTVWSSNAAHWKEAQVGAFAGSREWTVEVQQDAEVAPGTRVIRYTMASAVTAPVAKVSVLRWGPDWPSMAVCQLETPVANQALIDQVVAACARLDWVRP